MISARVRMFAIARDLAGQSLIELKLPDGATVADLKAAIAKSVPSLASLLPSLRFAVNAEYADDTTLIPLDAELAVIPPVSGGWGRGPNQ